MIQFKLGQELKQFRRSDMSKPAPKLDKPFWRFDVDTAEEDGQYDLLLKAERAGAEAHYVGPRFAHWDRYAAAFQSNEVLDNSLLIRPSEIDGKLRAPVEESVIYEERLLAVMPTEQIGRSPQQMARERIQRLENLRPRAKTEDDATFAAVGIETWAVGSQLIAVTTS